MFVYVGGKTQDLDNVRQVQALVRHTGHQLTYDWVKVIEEHGGDSNEVPIPKELCRQYAWSDMVRGVGAADLMIAIGHPNLCGTLWECGAAAITGIPIWLLWWERCSRHSIFEYLPTVQEMDFQELGEKLWATSRMSTKPVEDLRA